VIKIALNERVDGAKHFYWGEFLHLTSWGFAAFPDREQYHNLIKVAGVMDEIRAILGNEPIRVTSGLRPKPYNKLIGGSHFSRHMRGMACDFVHSTMSADLVREALLPYLDDLNIRMENLPGASWTHIDISQPGLHGRRYFKP